MDHTSHQVFTKYDIPQIKYELYRKYNYQENRLAIEKKRELVIMIKIDICIKNVRSVMLRSFIYIMEEILHFKKKYIPEKEKTIERWLNSIIEWYQQN